MKKGLLALAAGLLMTASASYGAAASQLYLIGEPAGGWSPIKGLAMTQTESGVFTIDVELPQTQWLGFSQKLSTSASDWSTMNGSRYGAPSNNYQPTLDEVVSLKYPSENTFKIGKGKYTFTVNTNNNTFKMTGQVVEDPTANVMYVLGGGLGWDAAASNKMTQNGNTYTLTVASLSGEFKIANADYSQQFSASKPIPNGTEVEVSNLGYTNSTLEDGTLTDVTIKFVKTDNNSGKLTITGTAGGGDNPPATDYSSWYVNVLGDFNSWADNGVNPVNGVAKHTNLAIGTKGFKVKIYNGKADTYYVSDGTAIPLDTWTQMYQDAYDASPSQIAGATETSVYNVEYNVETNQIYITLIGGDNPEPVFPDNMYVIGNVNGGTFQPNNGAKMDNEGDGLYTITGLKIGGELGSNYGYFSFTEKLAEGATDADWANMGKRYGAESKDYEVTLEEEMPLTNDGEASFKIAAGTYDITINMEDMTVYVEGEADPIVEPENPTATGTLTGASTFNGNEYPYTLYYEIVYNADKTLSIKADYQWTNGEIPGAVAGSMYFKALNKHVDFTLTDGIRTLTTVDTFEKDTELELQFYIPRAGGVTSDDITYTVGYNGVINSGNENPYEGWYLNVIGTDGNLAAGVALSAEGTATVKNVAIGTGTFEIKIWDGTADKYYSTGAAVKAGEWIVVPASQSVQMTVEGATEDCVYDVEWNQESTSVKLTLVSGGGLEPIEPATYWYEIPGTVTQTIDGTSTTYNYIVHATITYNTDKTLSVYAQFEYEPGMPVGVPDQAYVLFDGKQTTLAPKASNGPMAVRTNGLYGTTTETYTKDQVLAVHFKQEMANGATEADTTYTVGASNGDIPTSVYGVNVANEGEVMYFNLQGVRVANPTNGLYIRVANGKSQKIMVK